MIKTPRLELVPMSVPFMEALARHDMAAASHEIGAIVPPWLADELEDYLIFRLAQLRVDPAIRVWLARAMVLPQADGTRRVIGSIGFHGRPDEQGRLEVGYSVDRPYRRQGYASESLTALLDWAWHIYGTTRFVASISPHNEPSLRLAAAHGFRKVGEQMDDVDGLEHVFETEWPRPASN